MNDEFKVNFGARGKFFVSWAKVLDEHERDRILDLFVDRYVGGDTRCAILAVSILCGAGICIDSLGSCGQQQRHEGK